MRALMIVGLISGFTLVGVAAMAQGHGSHQRGMGMPYDLAKEATFTGTVAAVEEHQRGGMAFVALNVKVGDKDVQVMVGPSSFLASQTFTFAKGDALTILGVMAESPRGERIQPREITRGGAKLTVRDKDGKLLWTPPGRAE